MMWDAYKFIVIATVGLWLVSLSLDLMLKPYFFKKGLTTGLITLGGCLILGSIIWLWLDLDRPPMRTQAETRLWYAALLPLVGLFVDQRFKLRWLLYYCLMMSAVFMILILGKPDSLDKTLMPALQSIWFVPHVVVYMAGYALLAGAALIGAVGLFKKATNNTSLNAADQLVTIGFCLLSMGMLFGAFWAKEAWGHYWSWDPKETWAFLTWLVYVLYIHVRLVYPLGRRRAYGLLLFGFAVLMVCWAGVNYLPSASTSIHTYMKSQ